MGVFLSRNLLRTNVSKVTRLLPQSLLEVQEIWDKCEVNLSELINFYSPGNHQKTTGFLMISGGIEVNSVILE